MCGQIVDAHSRPGFHERHVHECRIVPEDTYTDVGVRVVSTESTMKAICAALKRDYEPKARASDLLRGLRNHGLFPDYLDNSFDQLLAVLRSGLPEVRNNEGGHGQGVSA